jgi:hypothetical protein
VPGGCNYRHRQRHLPGAPDTPGVIIIVAVGFLIRQLIENHGSGLSIESCLPRAFNHDLSYEGEK